MFDAIVHPNASERGPRHILGASFGYHQGKIAFVERPLNPALMKPCFLVGLRQQHQTHIPLVLPPTI